LPFEICWKWIIFGGVFVFGKFEIEVFLSCYKKKIVVKKIQDEEGNGGIKVWVYLVFRINIFPLSLLSAFLLLEMVGEVGVKM
jgi:hypothetical protein